MIPLLAVALFAAPPAPVRIDLSSALYVEAKPAQTGLVVVAMGEAVDAAWPLAQRVYQEPSLRPHGIDEASARVLAGEAPPEKAPKVLVDLAQMRGSVKGDDPASRAILDSIARNTKASAVVVVDASKVARVYVVGKDAFEPVRYTQDDASTWNTAVDLLTRAYGAPAAAAAPTTPTAALWEGPTVEKPPSRSRSFYETAWFWGALGAAAFLGGAFYFATRDNSGSTIHLQLQVPK